MPKTNDPANGEPPPCLICGGAQTWRSITRKGVVYWRKHCSPCDALSSKQWRANNRELSRTMIKDRRLIRVYGITRQQRDAAIERRVGLCDICGQPPPEHWGINGGMNAGERVLHIDHDHETGEIRGMLCGQCNKKLAWFEKYGETADRYLVSPPGLMADA